jgi:hypothetical protein
MVRDRLDAVLEPNLGIAIDVVVLPSRSACGNAQP